MKGKDNADFDENDHLLSEEGHDELLEGPDNRRSRNQDKLKYDGSKLSNQSTLLNQETPQVPKNNADMILAKAEHKLNEAQKLKSTSQQQVPFFTMLFKFALKHEKIQIGFAYFCAAIAGVLQPAQGILMGAGINEFTQLDDQNTRLKTIALLMILIGAITFVCASAYFFILERVGAQLGKRTKVAYLRALMGMEMAWYDQQEQAQLMANMEAQCATMDKALGKLMGVQVQVLFAAIFAFIFAFYISSQLAFLLLIYYPFFIVFIGVTRRAAIKGQEAAVISYGRAAGFAEQAINAIRVVAAFGREATELASFKKFLEPAEKIAQQSATTTSLTFAVFTASVGLFATYTFLIATYLILNQTINPTSGELYSGGDIIACYTVLLTGILNFFLLMPNMRFMNYAKGAAFQAFQIIDRKPQIPVDDSSTIKLSSLPHFSGQVEFQHVDFSYNPNTPVLRDFSAVFEGGKTTALVGTSGVGKSTIISLIERFYAPKRGQVLVGGVDLAEVNVKDLRRQIGFVSQEPLIFNATIKENVLYGKPYATEEEVIEALTQANIYNFIKTSLPKGILTEVGNAGTLLSGGQKQRITIARALIGKPKILLLDEATSALDHINEQDIISELDKLSGVTKIVVAHRLETVRHADKILFVERGQVVEEGTHEELMQRKGAYATMMANLQEREGEDAENSLGLNGSHSEDSRRLEERSYEKDKTQEKAQMTSYQMGKRLMDLSHPRYLYTGLLATCVNSTALPLIGFNSAVFLLVLMGYYGTEDMVGMAAQRTLIFALIVLFQFVFAFGQRYSFTSISVQVSFALKNLLYKSILRKHMGWFDDKENSPGVLISVMAKDTQAISGVVSEGLGAVVESTFCLIFGAIFSYFFSPLITLICMLSYPILIISQLLMHHLTSKNSKKNAANYKQASLLADDLINNHKMVAALSQEQQLLGAYESLLENQEESSYFGQSAVYGINKFAIMFANGVVFYAAAVLLSSDFNLTADIFISWYVMVLTVNQVANAINYAPDMGEAEKSSSRIFGVLDCRSKADALEKAARPADKTGKAQLQVQWKSEGVIEFKDVWFRYPNRDEKWVLRGFNLEIKAKQSVALIGESGCGKSTLVQLLYRFYDVTHGSITLDGQDIRHFPLGDLRRQMGLVMQDPTLFSYTLYENVLYGKGLASNQEIIAASKTANVAEFAEKYSGVEEMNWENIEVDLRSLQEALDKCSAEIVKKRGQKAFDQMKKELAQMEQEEILEKGRIEAVSGIIDYRTDEEKGGQLPEGYLRLCGMRGSKLSGGQKQRVAIARAIVRDPQVLILDEATSSLDEEGQAKVQAAIDNLMGQRTTLVIAHRLSTVEKCDIAVMMKGGRVVEQGNMQELRNNPKSLFYAYAYKQK